MAGKVLSTFLIFTLYFEIGKKNIRFYYNVTILHLENHQTNFSKELSVEEHIFFTSFYFSLTKLSNFALQEQSETPLLFTEFFPQAFFFSNFCFKCFLSG